MFQGVASKQPGGPQGAGVRIFIIQQHDMFRDIPIFIGYDNISAADCSFMKAVESSDSILAGFTAALHIDATSLCSIEGFHIHSHVGHPWNELADSICNYYKKGVLWSVGFLLPP